MNEDELRAAIADADLQGLQALAAALGIDYDRLRKRVQRGDPSIEQPVVSTSGPQWTAEQVRRMTGTVDPNPRRGRPRQAPTSDQNGSASGS